MATSVLTALAAAVLLALTTVRVVGWMRALLWRQGVCDVPNARSAHESATPRGAGIAVIALAAGAWIVGGLGSAAPMGLIAAAGLALALAAVSFRDDVRGLSAGLRFVAQALAVAAGLWAFEGGAVFQGLLPPALDMLAAGLLWLWFVNLYNFMDGVDGMTGVETVTIALGLIVVGLLAGWPGALLLPPLWLIAVAAGFLVWNWPPARVFLGDSGAVPLGFLIGWLLLDAAARGQWAVALILPGYYWADATVTLLRRLFRGEKIWHAHREHAYQRAARAGWSHRRTSGLVAVLGVALIGAAALAVVGPVAAGLAAAAGLVAATFAVFTWAGRKTPAA
jgi:UDP-N-acetylmuramyl pentapeptide phosphotransferase/UDP-N-acetylglucosamine-1-phosphate transferase